MYQVIGKDGQVYGPVDVDTLRAWAGEKRLEPATMMIDPISGQTLPAAQMLVNLDVFPPGAPPLAIVAQPPVPAAPAPVTHVHYHANVGSPQKNPGLAAVLCFFWPGLGQIYNGQIGKGIAFIIIQAFNYVLMFIIIGFLTSPIVWIWGMVDAYTTAERLNRGG